MLKIFNVLVMVIVTSTICSAQIELKINPVSALWRDFDISAEYGFLPNLSIDVSPVVNFDSEELDGVNYKAKRYGLVLNPRYYLSANEDLANFYVGIFGKYLGGPYKTTEITAWKNRFFSLGSNLGFKAVTESGLLFDIGFGIGNVFLDKNKSELGFNLASLNEKKIDFIGKLAIGYRF